jgi:hypothetical protein
MKANYGEINRVQNETHIIKEKIRTFENNYDEILDYLFNNWVIVQNIIDKTSFKTARIISIYAAYCAYKLKDRELMKIIAEEQNRRKPCIYCMMISLYSMEKYTKQNLMIFEKRWKEANENITITNLKEEEEFKDLEDDIKNSYFEMKRICRDYLYKANRIWQNLIISKHQEHDIWFARYSKVAKEYSDEN